MIRYVWDSFPTGFLVRMICSFFWSGDCMNSVPENRHPTVDMAKLGLKTLLHNSRKVLELYLKKYNINSQNNI